MNIIEVAMPAKNPNELAPLLALVAHVGVIFHFGGFESRWEIIGVYVTLSCVAIFAFDLLGADITHYKRWPAQFTMSVVYAVFGGATVLAARAVRT